MTIWEHRKYWFVIIVFIMIDLALAIKVYAFTPRGQTSCSMQGTSELTEQESAALGLRSCAPAAIRRTVYPSDLKKTATVGSGTAVSTDPF